MASSNPFEPNRSKETTDRMIKRLQDQIAGGNDHLRVELAEVLMRSAQESAIKEKFDISLKRIGEAIQILRQLVKEGEYELDIFAGRALLFQAAIIRFHKGPEAGITAFNEAIRHFVETDTAGDPQVQNELATALMTKADILIEPLGAYAAALAAQEQAAKIWRHLVDQGNPECRLPFINALMACSDSKVQNGDPESAIRDLESASEIAQEGVEAGETLFQPLFVQTLLKLSRLHDQEEDIEKAFETLRSAIRTVKKLVADGIEQAQMMFTTLYQHCGMLYEKIHDSESALAEFDRCRDVFVEMFRHDHWGVTESYIFRTGLANVLMCRGNMLADLKRYPEAEQAFEESVWQYQQAAEQRPPDDTDETLIPYSIGVVQLNHANMLVAQGKLEEAVVLKKQALDALQRRMESGHSEILPNFLAAYRKLIAIRQMQNEIVQVFELLVNMITVLEKAVDEGQLEYRIDLALTYRQRSIQRDEIKDYSGAQKDSLRALQIFRTIADDDRDFSDVHISKIQWSELLHQIAVLYVKQGLNDEAFDFFQKETEEITRFYEEGNDFAVVDRLLAYSQYIDFAETLGAHLEELQYPQEKFDLRLQDLQTYCQQGIELSQKKQNETGANLIAKLFFMMKTAFFYKSAGVLSRLQKNDELACTFFDQSIKHWNLLLAGLENLKAKDRYDAAEKGKVLPDWDIPGGTDDPYQDRYIFYMNELRETMQLGAKTHLACGRQKDSENLFEKENALTRELMKNGVRNADRFLIMSLTMYARTFLQKYPAEKTILLFEEALQVVQKRFESGDIVSEDFWVLKRVYRDFRDYLQNKNLLDESNRLLDRVVTLLSAVQTYPPPILWKDIWQVLEIPEENAMPLGQLLDVIKKHRKLFKKHPEFKTDKVLKKYDRQLKARLDQIKLALAEQSEPQE